MVRIQFLVSVLFGLVRCQGEDAGKRIQWQGDTHKLHDYLMKSYNKDLRPVGNDTDTVTVHVGLAIIRIMKVDEPNDELLMKAWMRYMWFDVRLQWKPADYGGVNVLRVNNDNIWKPDITLYNGNDDALNDQSNTKALIYSTGQVLWIPQRMLRSHCDFNLKNFPYDEHTCRLQFGSWTYDGFMLDLEFYEGREEPDMSDYVPHNGFAVTDTNGKKHVKYYKCCVEPFPDITFNMTFKRQPGFYVHFYVSPAVVMFLLMPFVFLVRPGSGRSTVLGSALMISSSVLITQVMEPAFANKSPTIMIYYSTTLILTAVCMMFIILLEIVYNNSGHSSPPRPLTAFCVSCLGRVLAVQEDEYSKCTPIGTDPDEKVDLRGERRAQWKALSLSISRLFFVVFLLINIILTIFAFA